MSYARPFTTTESPNEEYLAELLVDNEWIVDVRTRRSSSRKDTYYVERKTGLCFHSLKDVERYRTEGRQDDCKKKPQKLSMDEVQVLIRRSGMLRSSDNTPDVSNSYLETIPEPQLEPETHLFETSGPGLSLLDYLVHTPLEFLDVTSYPLWDYRMELIDDIFWARYVQSCEVRSGVPGEAPRQNPNADQSLPQDHDSGLPLPKQ